jgi:hypothetical protein
VLGCLFNPLMVAIGWILIALFALGVVIAVVEGIGHWMTANPVGAVVVGLVVGLLVLLIFVMIALQRSPSTGATNIEHIGKGTAQTDMADHQKAADIRDRIRSLEPTSQDFVAPSPPTAAPAPPTVHEPLAQQAPAVRPLWVPDGPEELRDLVNNRPRFWEYLLFAGTLKRELRRLDSTWGAYVKPVIVSAGPLLSDAQALAIAYATVRGAESCLGDLGRGFDAAAEDAFGPAGTPGNPVKIEYLAARIVSGFSELLELASTARAVRTGAAAARVVDLSTALVDQPIRQIRSWIDRVVEQVSLLPQLSADVGGQRTRLDLTLTIGPGPQAFARVKRELDRFQQVISTLN